MLLWDPKLGENGWQKGKQTPLREKQVKFGRREKEDHKENGG